jgi:YVTN family beta-propeller protein
MTYRLYPDPPAHGLSVSPSTSAAFTFPRLSAADADYNPPYAEVMFIRIAMLSGTAPPTFWLATGNGGRVEVSPDTQGVYAGAADSAYVGDVWLRHQDGAAWLLTVGLVNPDAATTWRLEIRNNDAVDQIFTAVVADDETDTGQPWTDPRRVTYAVAGILPTNTANSGGVAIDPARGRAYLADQERGMLAVVDLPTRHVISSIRVGLQPLGVVVDPATGAAFVQGQGRLWVIDPVTLAATAIPLPGGPTGRPVLDPVRRTLYASINRGGNPPTSAILMIDLDKRAVTATVPVAAPAIYGLAVDPVSHLVWVTNPNTTSVSVLDPDARTLTAHPIGARSWGAATDLLGRAVYICCPWDNTVVVVDTATRAQRTINGLRQPARIAPVDSDTHTVYIGTQVGTLHAIDTRTAASSTIRSNGMPIGLAVDTLSHRLLVAFQRSGQATLIERRPA